MFLRDQYFNHFTFLLIRSSTVVNQVKVPEVFINFASFDELRRDALVYRGDRPLKPSDIELRLDKYVITHPAFDSIVAKPTFGNRGPLSDAILRAGALLKRQRNISSPHHGVVQPQTRTVSRPQQNSPIMTHLNFSSRSVRVQDDKREGYVITPQTKRDSHSAAIMTTPPTANVRPAGPRKRLASNGPAKHDSRRNILVPTMTTTATSSLPRPKGPRMRQPSNPSGRPSYHSRPRPRPLPTSHHH